jgi:hypothetical protein
MFWFKFKLFLSFRNNHRAEEHGPVRRVVCEAYERGVDWRGGCAQSSASIAQDFYKAIDWRGAGWRTAAT